MRSNLSLHGSRPGGSAQVLEDQGPTAPDASLNSEKRRKVSAEHLLRTLLEHSPDCIYFKDRDSRLVAHSKAFNRLLALPEDTDLTGKTDFDFYGVDHAKDAFEDEQEILRTGRAILGKPERESHPDGRHTWALTSKMPWRDEDGEIIGTFGISKNITEHKEQEAKLEELHKRLVETSRTAGMAEVASDVLHNVGNVLTSINVACSLVMERVRESRLAGLGTLAALMEEQGEGLGDFIASDPIGRKSPAYVAGLRDAEAADREYLAGEMSRLVGYVDHIKRIVAMHQDYAKTAGTSETVGMPQLIDDALQINAAALRRHKVTTRLEIEEMPDLVTDKHKVLQVLVNLIRNAKYALDESGADERIMTIRAGRQGDDAVRIQVIDNGVGIPRENLTRIFSHGFTTRRNGHGFGLHSGALSARELGGSLEAHSEGPGRGAEFTLVLPFNPVSHAE